MTTEMDILRTELHDPEMIRRCALSMNMSDVYDRLFVVMPLLLSEVDKIDVDRWVVIQVISSHLYGYPSSIKSGDRTGDVCHLISEVMKEGWSDEMDKMIISLCTDLNGDTHEERVSSCRIIIALAGLIAE